MRSRYTQKCTNWPSGWMASDTVMRLCEKNKPAGSTIIRDGEWVGAQWIIDDGKCLPTWIGDDWNNDGCKGDGSRQWARQIDTRGGAWEVAADWMINNQAPKVGTAFKNGTVRSLSKNKDILGKIWILLYQNGDCFSFTPEKDEGCDIKSNSKKITRQCVNWPGGWTASGADTMPACAKNLPPGFTLVKSTEWIGGEKYIVNDCAYANNQFTYPGGDITNKCTAPGKRNKSKRCENWPATWTASGDVMKLCEKNKPPGSNMIWPTGSQWIGAEWVVDDASCNPVWAPGDWVDKGCEADGTHKWSRKIDAMGSNWTEAANWMISTGKIPKVGETFKKGPVVKITPVDTGLAGGMWIEVTEQANDCFVYTDPAKIEECDYVNNKQRMTQKCSNWPSTWSASDDVIRACEKNKPAGSTVVRKVEWVGAEWYVNNNCTYKDGNFAYTDPVESKCIE